MIIQKFAPSANRLVVIDGTAILFQNYFSPKLKIPSNAWLEALSQIREFFKAMAGKYWLVVFDAGPTSFRNSLYEPYKANRGEPPEDLAPQFELLFNAVQKCGIMVSMVKGFEADDLMAHWSKRAAAKKLECILVSQDKDLYQLLSEHVSLYNPRRQEMFDIPLFQEKYQVSPSAWPLIQAISGDSTDNYPGLKGVGEKSALSMAREMGDSFQLKEIEKFSFSEKVNKVALKCLDQVSELKLFLKISTLESQINDEESRSLESALWKPNEQEIKAYFLEIDQKRRLSAWIRLTEDYSVKFLT